MALTVLTAFLLLAGCGQYRSVPADWEPEPYKSITIKDLRAPRRSGLASGQKVKMPAYFWEFLNYDPAMVRNYLTIIKHPLAWPRLQWFAIYETPQMQGYFNRVAMDKEQQGAYRLKRLDQLLIYGELASMGAGLLYLRVHRMVNLEED